MQKRYIGIIILSLMVFAAYGNSLSGGFIWDDEVLIVNNRLLEDFKYIPEVFKSELHPDTSTNYYRPLETISFLADYSVYKLNPFGYHLTNILLHLLVGIFLFLLLYEMTKNYFLSLSTSLLFLVSPIHTEAVSYISGRADPLAGLCILISLWSYSVFLKMNQAGICGSHPVIHRGFSVKGFYLLSVFFAILSLLAKELAVVSPLALLWLDCFIVNTGEARTARIKRVFPFFLIVLIYLFLRMSLLNYSFGNPLLTKKGFAILTIGLAERAFIFFKTLVIYLGSLFIPFNLHLGRLIETEKIYLFHWAGLVIFLALCLFLILKHRAAHAKGKNLFLFSVLWFFIWLAPQSAFMFPKVMADHFLYLPSIGVFLMVAMYLNTLGGQQKAKVFLALIVFYCLLFTWFYNSKWRQELIFFVWTSRFTPNNYEVRDRLAKIYLGLNRADDAISEYKLILDPLGTTKAKEGFILFSDEVLSHPLLEEKREIVSNAFYNLGVIFFSQGRETDAKRAYECALAVNPRSAYACNNLGLIYEKMGNFSQAQEFFQRAINLDGRYTQAYNNLAGLYATKGDFKKAIFLWQKALEIDPDYDMAKKNIELAQKLIKND